MTLFVDSAFTFSNRLYILGWCADPVDPKTSNRFRLDERHFKLESGGEPRDFQLLLTFPRRDIGKHLYQTRREKVDVRSFILETDAVGGDCILHYKDEQIEFEPQVQVDRGAFDILNLYAAKQDESAAALTDEFEASPIQVLWSALSGASAVEAADRSCAVLVEYHHTYDKEHHLVEGWIAVPLGVRPDAIVSFLGDQPKIFSWNDLLTFQRRDVVEHYRNQDKIKGGAFGFKLFQAVDQANEEPNLLFVMSNSEVLNVPVPQSHRGSSLKVAASIFEARQVYEGPVPQIMSKLVDIQFEENLEAKPRFSEITVSLVHDKPTLSFVIPIYKRWDFMKYHLPMFDRIAQSLPPFEVLYVIDDLSIVSDIRKWVRALLPSQRFTMRVLELDGNYGFARASNVGLKAAAADNTIYMNSDVYISETDGMRAALQYLNDKPDIGLIGFTLLYEDGTIQHDGITFESIDDFFGVKMPKHPRKGRFLDTQVEGRVLMTPSKYVTGAFLLGKTERLKGLGGFPEHYVYGDFEDIELCDLSMKQYRNVLCRAQGLYHLERQSMSQVDKPAERMAILTRNRFQYEQSIGAAQ